MLVFELLGRVSMIVVMIPVMCGVCESSPLSNIIVVVDEPLGYNEVLHPSQRLTTNQRRSHGCPFILAPIRIRFME